MNTPRHHSNSARSAAIRLALLAAVLWLLPGKTSAQTWLTLANPHWNITLTDAGYSDFLLDNTPGFEGREYLSGEWGAAVGYQLSGGATVSPLWLEKNFSFPDWVTDSDFSVKSPITQIALNADNLPIAQSVLTNSHLEITMRHEMLDTVVGTPMGATRASAGGAGASIPSSRYVLKQTCTIKNISGGALSNVQLFQFLHGMNSQRGVYDNRAYSGSLSNFQYDVTLAGVDPSAVGTNSSSAGLEDFLGFHASVAPSAFEIGAYGIEGNGLDDHSIGKPSDGVHLSIENNWLTPPYSTRQGTDEFTPAQRWVSGAERWNLGSLPNGQAVSLDVILSLRTGTRVTTGSGSTGGCNGGSGVPGGVDYEFETVETEGSCFADYSQADETEITTRVTSGEFEPFTFMTPGGAAQIWNVSFTGTNSGAILLTFAYDPTILPGGLDQDTLCIYHFHNHAWTKLTGTVDLARHTITVTTPNLSAFALGVSGGTTYTVSTSVSPGSGGTVAGGGTFASGANVTLIATPAAGYAFTNWTEGAAVVSSSPNYNFTAQADRTLAANFVSAGGDVIITTSALPANGGATLGDGAYAPGTIATVVAIPNVGYKFSKWMVNGASVSTSRTNSFTVETNRVLVAKFKPIYTVAVSADPPSGGDAEADSSKYEPGELAKMRARPNSGWCFVNWTQNGVPVSTDPDFQFNVTANRTLVGHFAFGNRIDASVYLGVGGTVTGAGVYQPGASVTVVANANPGYAFLNWTEDNAVVSMNDSYTFTCTANRALLANFTAAAVSGPTISVSASPIAGGTVSGGGLYTNGASATVIATANSGFGFVNWTEAGLEVSTAASYSFTVAANRTLVANFSTVATNPIISAIATPFVGGTVTGDGTYTNGDWVGMSATANPGYAFVNWTDHGTPVCSWSYYSFMAESNRTLVANFASVVTIATIAASTNGTAGGDGDFPVGASVGVVAAPRAGFVFANWTESGVPVSSNASYTFTAGVSRALVANFAADLTSATFDFDAGMPALTYLQTTPFTQTAAGLTAQFSSPAGPAFSVQCGASNFWVMPKFSGNYLYPHLSGGELEIRFTKSVTSIALTFATFDWQDLVIPTALKLEAFVDSTNSPAGSVTNSGTVNLNDTAPVSGQISLKSATPFNLVRVSLPPAGPLAATDFMVDNITVTTIPALNIQPAGAGFAISWPVTETYVLQKCTGLAAPNWADVTSGIVTVGNEKRFTETTPGSAGFFRLVRP